jgi:hypothetical protein
MSAYAYQETSWLVPAGFGVTAPGIIQYRHLGIIGMLSTASLHLL